MNAKEIFKQFEQLNIIVIGDVMIDRYLTGKVDRISPEAPVPVIQLQQEENRLGGAANVALNIQAMGASPFLFSISGKDDNGQLLQELLPKYNLSPDYVLSLDSRTTTVKTRVIAQNQHLLRVDREGSIDLSTEESDFLYDQLVNLLNEKTIHLILFQDYNKGVLTDHLIRKVIAEASNRSIPTAVDPKDKNFWSYEHVTLFKPNLREIQQQLGFDLKPELNALNGATESINQRLSNQYTMITLSDKGLYIDGDNESQIMPTFERSITDVCGAGDTVISVAALGLAMGLPLPQIAILANLAGGQVCEKVGVVPVNRDQLLAEYSVI